MGSHEQCPVRCLEALQDLEELVSCMFFLLLAFTWLVMGAASHSCGVPLVRYHHDHETRRGNVYQMSR